MRMSVSNNDSNKNKKESYFGDRVRVDRICICRIYTTIVTASR